MSHRILFDPHTPTVSRALRRSDSAFKHNELRPGDKLLKVDDGPAGKFWLLAQCSLQPYMLTIQTFGDRKENVLAAGNKW